MKKYILHFLVGGLLLSGCSKEGKMPPIDETIEIRRIVYWEDENKCCFGFVTNLFGMNAGHITLIYKK